MIPRLRRWFGIPETPPAPVVRRYTSIYSQLVAERGVDPLAGVHIDTHPMLAEGVTAAVSDGDCPALRNVIGIRDGRLVFDARDVLL